MEAKRKQRKVKRKIGKSSERKASVSTTRARETLRDRQGRSPCYNNVDATRRIFIWSRSRSILSSLSSSLLPLTFDSLTLHRSSPSNRLQDERDLSLHSPTPSHYPRNPSTTPLLPHQSHHFPLLSLDTNPSRHRDNGTIEGRRFGNFD
jgi:hypothetical protein